MVLVVATTGEGDPTDNAITFNRYITSKATPADAFKSVKYAVFGLGDLNYINFNQMGKRTETNMDRLGAVKVYPRGVGDSSQDIEGDLRKWIDGGLVEAIKQNSTNTRIPSEKCIVDAPSVNKGEKGTLSKIFLSLSEAMIVGNGELRQETSDYLSTREIFIRLKDAEAKQYSGCDTLEILPRNSDEIVSYTAMFLEVDTDLDAHIDSSCLFPTPCTYRTALTQYIDLSCCPSRQFLVDLAGTLGQKNPFIERALILLSENPILLKDMESNYFISFPLLMEILQHHFGDDIRINISDFFQIARKQKIRSYTGAGIDPNRIRIVSSLTYSKRANINCFIDELLLASILPRSKIPFASKLKSSSLNEFKGLCGSFLARLDLNEKILLRIRPSSLRFKSSDKPPRRFLAICTGAGIAPFLAYIDWFESLNKWPDSTILVFGCRNPESDFIYKNRICQLSTNGKIQAKIAFSREERKYVQDIVSEDLDVRDILKRSYSDRKIIVCGKTCMAQSVCEVIAAHVEDLEDLQRSGIFSVEHFG